MNRFILLACALLWFQSVDAQNPNPSSTIDNFIAGEMNFEKIPGMSTVVVKGGEIVWIESYGWADIGNNIAVTDTTVFMLASVSKLFTGTALMTLYENGMINLDENISNYLPFSIDNPNHPSDSITFRMLMTHTSSIKDNDPVMDTYYSVGDPTISLADVIQRYFDPAGSDYDPVNNFHPNAPGTFYDYSNIATALAGYMVEVVSGTPFDQYCRTQLFDKLCMNSTSWYLSDFDTSNVARPYTWSGSQYIPFTHYGFADYPDGQLRTTVTDIANFMIAFLQDGAFNSQQILNASSVNQMLTPQVPSLDPTQGLNWYTELVYLSGGGTVTVWGHNGGESGVSTDLYINPANDIGIAVLTNGEGDNLYVVDELYNYALTLPVTGTGNPSCAPLSAGYLTTTNTELNVYPNPSDGKVFVESTEAIKELTVYNSIGQKIICRNTISRKADITLHESGVYFVIAITEKGEKLSGKLIVR